MNSSSGSTKRRGGGSAASRSAGAGSGPELRLVSLVQRLAGAKGLEDIQEVVRHGARVISGADGATVVLRERNLCYYADEDAIGPLWKGQRFPMQACVSGLAMLQGQAIVIPDIYADPRVPHDAYRPTFVRSMVMVPIGSEDPVGAIGTYWAGEHHATPHEVHLLQALANSTAVALKNISIHAELELRVRERTAEAERSRNEAERARELLQGVNRTLQQEVEARTKELAERNRELEQALRAKDLFLANLNHELRTPLNAIIGFTGTLLMGLPGPLNDQQQQQLGIVQQSARHLLGIITDLLQIAKIDSGLMRLSSETIQCHDLLQEVARDFAGSADQKGLSFVVAPVTSDLSVVSDRRVIRRILSALCGNAIKFTEKGTVTLAAQRSGAGRMLLSVSDTGKGIAPELEGRVFDSFGQMDSTERTGPGLGLRLAIRLAGLIGGELTVKNDVGRGCQFVLSLPAG